jgi:hypothetical protein
MDGLLGFGPRGDWELLGAHAPSLELFIEGNLKAHAPSWKERFYFWLFDFFFNLFFFNEKCK